jgi:hypothetical protein
MPVPANEPFLLRFGWGAKTKGLVIEYTKAEQYTLTIGGLDQPNVSDYWEDKPVFLPDEAPPHWRAWVFYPATGPDLGETVDVTLEFNLKHKLHDGFRDENNKLFFFGPGNWSTVSCNIIGV